MAGVQRRRGAIHGEAEPGHAARAEREPRQAARVDRAVAEDPEVGGETLAMRRERACEVRRARLFLALEEELEVRGQRDLRGIERVEGREHRDDRALVVARRARIDACFAGERKLRLRPGNHRRAVLRAARAQHGLEGRRLPCAFRADRLAVEMRIEKERALRALHAAFAVDGNRAHPAFPGSPRRCRAFPACGPAGPHSRGCLRRSSRRSAAPATRAVPRRSRPHAWPRTPPRRPSPAPGRRQARPAASSRAGDRP